MLDTVNTPEEIKRFAMLGNHLPRHCGIATFTTHLADALAEALPDADGFVLAMNDAGRRHAYPVSRPVRDSGGRPRARIGARRIS